MPERKKSERRHPGGAGKKADHKERVWGLRLAGVDFAAIARECGISKTYAYTLYREELDERAERIGEMADRYVAEQVEQLDKIILAHWPQRGDVGHAATILRCLDSKRKLLGLDVQRVEHSGTVDVVHEAAAERRRRILEETADAIASMTPEELAAEAAGLQ